MYLTFFSEKDSKR